MLTELVKFDTRTLIGTLVWLNAALGLIVYLYQTSGEYKEYNHELRDMVFIRFMMAIGFLCMFYRDRAPDSISINLGNTLFFIALTLESRLMIRLVNNNGKKRYKLALIIGIASIILFNTAELIYSDASIRIGLASIFAFLILLPSTLVLLDKSVTSGFKRRVWWVYVIMLIALIQRSIEAFRFIISSLHANTHSQTILFVTFIMVVTLNTIIYLLFMKESSDIKLEKMATLDYLTSILNRRAFLDVANRAFEISKKRKKGTAVLFLDVDYFKRANDLYGHAFGDNVLARFSDIISSFVRPYDICCRYGGDEFLILLHDVDTKTSAVIADRIVKSIAEYRFEEHPEFSLTMSVGVACSIPKEGETLEDFIRCADVAMYDSKSLGRNKYVVYEEVPPASEAEKTIEADA